MRLFKPMAGRTRVGRWLLRRRADKCTRGQIEWADKCGLRGWAVDKAHPDQPLELEARVGERVVGRAVADRHRADLAEAGIGTGHHGFELGFSPWLVMDQPVELRVINSATGRAIPGLELTFDATVSHRCTVEASIERVDARTVVGWARDRAAPEAPVTLVVHANGTPIGTLIANESRDDLHQAGLGECGFTARIDQHWPVTSDLQISLHEHDSARPVNSAECSIDTSDPAVLEIQSLGLDGVRGRVQQSGQTPLDANNMVCLHANDQFVASVALQPDAERGGWQFHQYLPAALFDGVAHVFEAELAGVPSRCTAVATVLPSVQTPWSLIAECNKTHGYNWLSRQSGWRYQGLQKQIRRIADGPTDDPIDGRIAGPTDLSWLHTVQRAHDYLVASHESREPVPLLALPRCEVPEISIVIPVFNQFRMTVRCLASLCLAQGQRSFEVIVIDDASTDETCDIEVHVQNLVVLRNTDNQGFLNSCNRAVAQARGRHVMLLNNDTEVAPQTIDEMRDVFERFDDVGAVGAKLVYPDGRLQDAGGLVWNNGVPWNTGHDQNPDDPRFNYVREVDYLTAAALMIERSAWEAVGGFSEAYIPAYYEDTDLSFKLRDAGFRTLYCPHATVVHYEGRSNGTSVTGGIKRYQAINAAHFVSTWQHAVLDNGQEGVQPDLEKDRNRALRVLMIDHAFPRLGQDAGSYAAVQEMRLLIALGCKVTFVPHNFEHLGEHTERLQKMGVECIHAPFHTSVGVFLAQRGQEFDAVYVTRYDVAERILDDVRRLSNARLLFNNADLHFLREMRAAVARGDTDMSGPKQTRDRELAVMDQVDAVLSYNETEHAIIDSHLMRSEHVFKCPWVLERAPRGKVFVQRSGIVFMGGFGHPPNEEAAWYLLDEVMPLIHKQRPDIVLNLWGSRMPESLYEQAADNVQIGGFAESLEQVFGSARLFVAPLLSGAGVKGKVLDSIAHGVPTVLSPIAAEATGLVDGLSTRIARTPEQWCAAIVSLYDNEQTWLAMRERADHLIETEYAFDTGLKRMAAALTHAGLQHAGLSIPDMQATDAGQFDSADLANPGDPGDPIRKAA